MSWYLDHRSSTLPRHSINSDSQLQVYALTGFWRERPDKKRESPHLAWIATTSHKIWIGGNTQTRRGNLLILPGLRRPLIKFGSVDPDEKVLCSSCYGPSKPAFWREHPDKKRESPYLAWIATTSHKNWCLAGHHTWIPVKYKAFVSYNLSSSCHI